MFKIEDYLSTDQVNDLNTLTNREDKRLLIQKFVLSNFPLLVYILGYRDLGEFHKEQLKEIAKEDSPRRLWLWARGHFKTSLIAEAHSVFLILKNPDIRILIVSNTLEIAKKVLGNIKSHFVVNTEFRYFFKEWCPVASEDGKIEFGTTENFTVPNRARSLKEPTVMCAGIGTNLTGLHFDWMKIDDLVTRDSVSNDTQILVSKDYYASLRQLFDNPTKPREDVIGTTYHFADLYSQLQKNEEFSKSFIPAKKEGKIMFSERFSEEGLDKILHDPSVGPYEFSSQYMLNPINPLDAKFKEEWIAYYDTLPEGMAEYICVDPASTQKKKSDFTVLERWGVDFNGRHYLLEGVRDKLTSFQRIDRLFEMASHARHLKWVKYEVLGGRHGDLEHIHKKMLDKKVWFQIKETKATSAAKADRIEQRLVGPFHAGIILLPRNLTYRSEYDGKTHDFIQEYKLEYLQFPFTEHDDILDCHSQMFEERVTLGTKKPDPPKEDLFMKLRQLAIDKKYKKRKGYIFGQKSNRFIGVPAERTII